MGIDYAKRGLRLGYMIRGRYVDSAGTAQALRLAGPSSRVGTGLTAPDPDASAPAFSRYWRAGSAAPTFVEDLGKLDQHLATLNTLSLTVRLDYPERADSEVPDTSEDGTLRGHAVSGRWTNRDVDMWFVDLDTGDTDPRMRARWDRDATSVQAGSFALTAKEQAGILGEPWKMGRVPSSTAGFVDTIVGAAGSTVAIVNSAGIFVSPNTATQGGITGRGFQLAPEDTGKWMGTVFGYDAALGATGTSPAPCWREVVYYGGSPAFGSGSFIGQAGDPVFWFWVSPQYGCTVGGIRAVDDDGVVYENGSGSPAVIAPSGLIGHNYDPTRGPLGTFIAVQFDLSGGEAFSFTDNSNRVYARIHGPPLLGATTEEWSATYGEPFTRAFGSPLAVVEDVWDILDLALEDPEYLDANPILGTTATADFAAANPSSVTGFAQVLAAVPQELTDEPITYREALTGLVAGLGADLVWRLDTTVGERRLFPLWRGPRPGQSEDFTIRASDLASLAPRPSVRQQADPFGEYSNETSVNGPDFIDQPSSVPFAANDVGLLTRMARFGRLITDPVEQSATGFNGVRARKRTWNYWSPKTQAAGNESARYLAAEVDQPQIWTSADLGGEWMRLQLGDLIRYQIHGITSAVGSVRRIEYSLEAQTVSVSAVHITEFEPGTGAGGGGGD